MLRGRCAVPEEPAAVGRPEVYVALVNEQDIEHARGLQPLGQPHALDVLAEESVVGHRHDGIGLPVADGCEEPFVPGADGAFEPRDTVVLERAYDRAVVAVDARAAQADVLAHLIVVRRALAAVNGDPYEAKVRGHTWKSTARPLRRAGFKSHRRSSAH